MIYSFYSQTLCVFFLSLPVHPGAETHTHTEAPTVAANWTDFLVIDLLQVSMDPLYKTQLELISFYQISYFLYFL